MEPDASVSSPSRRVSKRTLLLVTLLLGGVGGHKFYLRRYFQGALYVAFCWFLFLPLAIALIELLVYAFSSEDALNRRYGEVFSAPPSKWSIAFAVVTAGVTFIVASTFYQVYDERGERAHAGLAMIAAKPWREAIEAHYSRTRRLPSSAGELGQNLPPAGDATGYGVLSLGPDGVITVTYLAKAKRLEGKTVIYRASPNARTGALDWDCTGGTLPPKYRPGFCR